MEPDDNNKYFVMFPPPSPRYLYPLLRDITQKENPEINKEKHTRSEECAHFSTIWTPVFILELAFTREIIL